MDSPFANLFLAVQARLLDQVPELATIDQDLMQFEHEKPPVNWPAGLIDMEAFQMSDMGALAQIIQGIVLIRIGYNPYSNTGVGVPQEFKEQALSYYDIEFKVYKALHGWSPGGIFGKLTRVSANTDKERDLLIRVRELRFAIGGEDYSAKKAVTTHKAEPELTVQFEGGTPETPSSPASPASP